MNFDSVHSHRAVNNDTKHRNGTEKNMLKMMIQASQKYTEISAVAIVGFPAACMKQKYLSFINFEHPGPEFVWGKEGV